MMDMSSLQDIAPLHLVNFRVRRYLGDDICLPLDSFAKIDQGILRELYAFLLKLQELVRSGAIEGRIAAARDFTGRADSLETLIEQIQTLGTASYHATPSALLGKTIHDLRGGALTALFGHLQIMANGDPVVSIDAIYFLTRDHLKIMRNALLGLDDERRESDLLRKVHGTDFIVEKWNGATLPAGDRRIRLTVDCPEPADISECCVEFGALDRILYNLINNACRHTVSEEIRLFIFATPQSGAGMENLRFVLLNTVSVADGKRLRSLEVQSLFETGVSSTGSGFGLSVAADFVSHAFGIANPVDAVHGGYLGARLIDDNFAVWFHWPVVAGI